MEARSKSLWRHKDFVRLWSAQTTSLFGTHLASLAYPLTAVITLQATSFEVGALQATGSAAAASVGLFAGVIVDRVRRKPLLIATDLGRALLAVTIPIAAFLGILRIEQLYIVGFLAGVLNMTGEVAIMAFVPSVVKKEDLVDANSKLSVTESTAWIVGSGFSGALVQILTAPVAIIIDAVSFVVSAAFVLRIRTTEDHVSRNGPRKSVWKEIGEGMRFVYGNPILRPMSQALALHFLFLLIITTIFTLYAIRELNITPFLLGIILSALGIGFLLGALTAGRLTGRFGIGRTMIGGTLINAVACLMIPLASGSLWQIVPVLMLAHLVLAFGIQIHGINLMSLRQSITPDKMQGRMTGTFRYLNVGMMMVGALAAGILGDMIGYRATMLVGSAGMFLPFMLLLFSPIRNIDDRPA